IRSALSEQTIRARSNFALKIVSCDWHEVAKILVRFHQQALINLSDELFRDSGNRDNSQLKGPIRFLLEKIEDLIHFLQSQYADLFNFELRPSEFYTLRASQNLKSIRDQIDAMPLDEGARDLLK